MRAHFQGGGNKTPIKPPTSLREVAVAETQRFRPPVCRHSLGHGAESGQYLRRHRANGTAPPGGSLRLREELPFGATPPVPAPRTPARPATREVTFFPLPPRTTTPACSILAIFAAALR